MFLPTYEEAMDLVKGLLTESKRENALRLVAPYLDPHTLTVCRRVCQEWNRTLTLELWADPLGVVAQMSRPFSRAIQFRNASLMASPFTRSCLKKFDAGKLLRLRHEVSNRLDWNQNDHIIVVNWFLSFMHLFTNLRFVILDELNGFMDKTWVYYDPYIFRAFTSNRTESIYKPIMLSASNCRDLDGIKPLQCAPYNNLWYLDLSYTDWQENSLFRFSKLPLQNLRVLKLRGLRLTDGVFPAIYRACTNFLWSLDLRDNLFTDAIIPGIVNHLLLPRIQRNLPTFERNTLPRLYEDAPAYAQHSSNDWDKQLASIRPDSKEEFIQYLEDHGDFSAPDAQFLDDDDPLGLKTGLTQLYLSGNQFSHEKLINILNGHNQLQVLDCGTVVENKTRPTLMGYHHSAGPLHRATGTRLEVIRMHHSVVTYCKTTCGVGSNYQFWNSEALQNDEEQGKQASAADDAFTPFNNHRITSLTLTGIPSHSHGFILQRLIELIRECAEQECQINAVKAQFPRTRTSPILLPGLRTLRLEFIPKMKYRQESYNSSSSVSGDKDADTFLAESMQDFSFFPSSAAGAAGMINQPAGLMKECTTQEKDASEKKDGHQKSDISRTLDVVKELKVFRAQEGKKWTGKLQLVLPDPESQTSN